LANQMRDRYYLEELKCEIREAVEYGEVNPDILVELELARNTEEVEELLEEYSYDRR